MFAMLLCECCSVLYVIKREKKKKSHAEQPLEDNKTPRDAVFPFIL